MKEDMSSSEPRENPVFLDHNATTPLAPEVSSAIKDSLDTLWGNPSSGYETGQKAAVAVIKARGQVGTMLGAAPGEITFTSGGTEANHLAIWSAVANFRKQTAGAPDSLPHIVTTNIEHCALSLPLQRLETEGLITVTRVPAVKGTGRVTLNSVLDSCQPNTCLVSVMLANNETGVIQPVREIFKALKEHPPKTRVPILLHTDAAQVIGKMKVDVEDLHCDLLTIVGHKFYGPRIGALYHRTSVKSQMTPMFYGGGQEGGLRPGTENTPMIVGLGVSAALVSDHILEYEGSMREARDYLRDQLIRNFRLVTEEGKGEAELERGQVCWRYVDRLMLPNTLSLRFGGFTGAEVLKLCKCDFEASTSAACHTGGPVSQILLNSFLWSEAGCRQVVRLSVGRNTSHAMIERVVAKLKEKVG